VGRSGVRKVCRKEMVQKTEPYSPCLDTASTLGRRTSLWQALVKCDHTLHTRRVATRGALNGLGRGDLRRDGKVGSVANRANLSRTHRRGRRSGPASGGNECPSQHFTRERDGVDGRVSLLLREAFKTVQNPARLDDIRSTVQNNQRRLFTSQSLPSTSLPDLESNMQIAST
jgi:hypothetical protein